MTDIKIPFGLCSITYGDEKLPAMADEGVFSAIPTYVPMHGGALNSVQGYILESYDVRFTVSINSESYEALKLHMQTLQSHEHGLYDNPSKVSMEGKQLIIHPYAVEDRELDICIWNAYISPETGFNRTFKKEVDQFEITFIGKPVKNGKLKNSYFFIGDWLEAGVDIA